MNNEDGDDDDDDDVDDFPPPLVIDAPEVCEDSHSEYGSLRNSDEKDSVTSGDSSTKRSSTNGSPSKKSRKEDKARNGYLTIVNSAVFNSNLPITV